MWSGPVSGERTRADPSRMLDEVAQPTAECRPRTRVRPREDHALGVHLARRVRPPTSTGCSPNSCSSASAISAHRSGGQSFSGLLVADDDRGRRTIDPLEELPLPRPFGGPRPEVPDHRHARHAERREELEILVLDVLRRVRREAFRLVNSQLRSRARARSKPSLMGARVSAVTSPALKYTWRSSTRSNSARARVRGARRRKRRQPRRAVEEHDVIHDAGGRAPVTPVRAATPSVMRAAGAVRLMRV